MSRTGDSFTCGLDCRSPCSRCSSRSLRAQRQVHRQLRTRPSRWSCVSAISRTSRMQRRSSASTRGSSRSALDDNVTLKTQFFNAGTDVVEAIFSEALDASYIGPESGHQRIRAVGRRGDPHHRRRGLWRRIPRRERCDHVRRRPEPARSSASPSLGNTQDVALRAWLSDQGYATDLEGGGDVSIMPQANGDALQAFILGEIDGAWVPEPWATRMVEEGDGHVLVDERDLWPDGEFVTTHLIVATSFLEEHPDRRAASCSTGARGGERVRQRRIRSGRRRSSAAAIARADRYRAARRASLASAWENLTFTVDPIASIAGDRRRPMRTELGLLDPVDLDGIYDLTLLNEVLAESGSRPDSDAVTIDVRAAAIDESDSHRLSAGAAARDQRRGRSHKAYGPAGSHVLRAVGHVTHRRKGRVRVSARRFGLRQEHAAEPDRGPVPGHLRLDRRRRSPGRAAVPGTGAVPVADGGSATSRWGMRLSAVSRPRSAAASRRGELLRLVHLENFAAERRPELSGGMRQRGWRSRARWRRRRTCC